jgi:hypothetical protein
MSLTAVRALMRWKLSWPYSKPKQITGRVSNIEYTWGAGGNQYTTFYVDDKEIKCATYWNSLTKDWEIGEMVTFELYWDNLHLGYNKYKRVRHARNIRQMK